MQGGLVKCEDIPKFAGRIYKESQRLLQLVEDVIQISQLDRGKNILHLGTGGCLSGL